MEFTYFDQYQLETRRTAPAIDDKIGCLLNFSMGLSGESSETLAHLDKKIYSGIPINIKKVAKELGDLLWYTARASDVIGRKLSWVANLQLFDDFQEEVKNNGVVNEVIEKGFDTVLTHYATSISIEAGEITDHMKKVAFQGHELEEEKIETHLKKVLTNIAIVAYLLGYRLSKVAMMNVDKLRTRYPKGFSVEDSVNRKDIE